MQIARIQKQQYANAGMPPLLVSVKDMMRYFLMSFVVDLPPVKTDFYCAFRRKRKIGTNDTEMKREECFSRMQGARVSEGQSFLFAMVF
jgi:hypothetical protein